MLSYRHSFHAGNHADVLKHLCLIALLKALVRKPKPLCYFETHAGAGMYDIRGEQALCTGEFASGAERILCGDTQDLLLLAYRDLILNGQSPAEARHYPGSPQIAQTLLREQDRLILCELHSTDAALLRQHCRRDGRVHVHERDGFGAIKAVLPPPETRGLVLIDPPYENKQDYATCVDAVQELRRRFRAAGVALWYPRLPRAPAQPMLDALKAMPEEWLHVQLDVAEELGDFGMFGSGMWIIQPPWGLREEIEASLSIATRLLGPGARFRIEQHTL